MRLFLLPISPKHTLLYAQRLNRQLVNKQGYIERITAWANKKWTQWEASDGRVQKKVTAWGNAAFNRIPYQEWGLKSVPPLSTRKRKEELRGREQVEAVFPSSIIEAAKIPGLLRAIATERQALHRKWMWWSIVGIPFTIPVGLIPVIPNLPFFYLTFRAWSHWRALAGSKHIEFLLQNNLVKHVESPILSRIYTSRSLPKEELDRLKKSSETTQTQEAKEKQVAKVLGSAKTSKTSDAAESESNLKGLYTSKQTGKLISICFGIPQVHVELERANAQVTRLITKEEKASKVRQEEEKR